ncbi:MAG: hypothetical protein J5604_08275 [Bacteroidales bacterium]|nr:hypothetical protein [Bacteroidales bacterium]
MKKLYMIGLAIVTVVALSACTKDNSTTKQKDASVSIIASYEQPTLVNSDGTKVSISESGSKFNLFWEGNETMSVANSSKTGIKDDFSTTDAGTTSATFVGATGLPAPDAEYTGDKINYIGVVSSFASTATNTVRGAIRIEQIYDPTNPASISKNAFLVARTDNCEIGSLSSLSFKTMNAFMKFSLTKGDPASGSSHTYPKMYVKNIVIESINEEYISGRFGISKTDPDWTSSYAEEIEANCSKTVTLDCTNGNTTKGVELGTTAKDFYIALASKTYAKGLKITINVQNEDGDLGKMDCYYKQNNPVDIGRNKLIRMAPLSVEPEDVSSEIICWSENWNGGVANQTPEAYLASLEHTGTVVYGGSAISYGQTTTSTKLYTGSMSAGGIEPELLLCKKAKAADAPHTWTITGIPTADGTTLSLTYKTNSATRITVTSPTTGVTITGSSPAYTITPGTNSTITLVFSNTTTSNVRIDDVVLKVVN